jgi:hypothetical protein
MFVMFANRGEGWRRRRGGSEKTNIRKNLKGTPPYFLKNEHYILLLRKYIKLDNLIYKLLNKLLQMINGAH